MSTSTEITRLTQARNTIRNKVVEIFGNNYSAAKIDDLATVIDGITNQGAINAEVQEGATYTIPSGYHNGSGIVSGVAGGGNYTLQAKTVTPTKTQQNVTPDTGKYGLSAVTVEAIPSAYQDVTSVTAEASNVLANKIFVNSSGTNVAGTMPNNGAVTQTISVATPSYTIPSGYHNGSGKVSLVTETKSATPSATAQTITPTTGKVLSSVTVAAIPSDYQNITNVDATAADVLTGKTFVTADGEVTGAMPNNGAVSQTLDATSNNQSYTVPAGYHSGTGTVNIVLENKAATPATSSQDITPTAGKVLGKVTVNAIPSKYQDTTNVDATAADVLTGKTFVTATGEVEGAMVNNGAVSKTLDATTDNQSYTIPAGYHNGSGAVNITLETKGITPTKSQQNVYPTSGKVLSRVTIDAIPSIYQDTTNVDATASNVLNGKTFVTADGEVTGTMPVYGPASVTLSTSTTYYTISQGYHSSGNVHIALQSKSATPTTASQTITPDTGRVLSSVTVAAIPSKYGDTTDDTGVAANVLAGIKVHTISNGAATQITGTMANNGAISGTIDGLATTSYTIPAGYTSGGSVSLTNDIETALAAI